MKCLHHTDHDGEGSAFLVAKHTSSSNPEDFIPMNYNKEFPIDVIQKDEEVYIVDFSISPDDMRELLKITTNVHWIDHHKTAIEKYEGFEHEIKGLRYDGVAACELTYVYLKILKGTDKSFDKEMLKEVPEFIALIGDRDVWKWEYEETKDFCSGLSLYDTKPTSSVWNDLIYLGEAAVKDICCEGRIANIYRARRYEKISKAFSYDGKVKGFEDKKAIILNQGIASSEAFEAVKKEYHDFMIAYVYDGEFYSVSLYTNGDMDVSKIAKHYGGGGHRGAAGFKCKKLPIIKDI